MLFCKFLQSYLQPTVSCSCNRTVLLYIHLHRAPQIPLCRNSVGQWYNVEKKYHFRLIVGYIYIFLKYEPRQVQGYTRIYTVRLFFSKDTACR
jgi:hypothetical protein